MKNQIKILREQAGLTQSELAEKTGLSLRTIQRVESSDKPPKGHTLATLAAAFDMEPKALHERINTGSTAPTEQTKRRDSKLDTHSMKLVNLGLLGMYLFPLGNVLLPLLIWKYRPKSALLDEAARKITNAQIIWTICFYVLLCLSPFAQRMLSLDIPLILVVLLLAVTSNLFLLGRTAYAIQQEDLGFLDLPLRLL